MAQAYAKTMFSEAAKRLQEQHGSRAAYERREALGRFGMCWGSLSGSLLLGGIRFIWRR